MYYLEKYNVIILIPARNEFGTLKKILKNLLKKKFKILLIDDASDDETRNIRSERNLIVLRNKNNLGYEETIKKGFNFIKRKKKISHIITFDADGEHRILDLKKLTRFYKFDLVIGKRSKKNRLFESIISYIFFIKFKFYDPLSGLKMYSIRSLKKYNPKKNLYLVDLAAYISKNKKFKSINTEIKTKKRKGKPRIGNSISVNIRFLKILNFLIFA